MLTFKIPHLASAIRALLYASLGIMISYSPLKSEENAPTVKASRDKCDAILDVAYKEFINVTDSEKKGYASDLACLRLREIDKRGTIGTLGFSYKDFGLDANADITKYKAAYKQYCSNRTSAASDVFHQLSYSKVADPAVVEAWRDCMLEYEGVWCDVKPEYFDMYTRSLSLNVNYRGGQEVRATALGSMTNLRHKERIYKGIPEPVKEGEKIPFNGRVFSYEKKKTCDEISLTQNFDVGAEGARCDLLIPACPKRDLITVKVVGMTGWSAGAWVEADLDISSGFCATELASRIESMGNGRLVAVDPGDGVPVWSFDWACDLCISDKNFCRKTEAEMRLDIRYSCASTNDQVYRILSVPSNRAAAEAAGEKVVAEAYGVKKSELSTYRLYCPQ